MTKKKRGKEKTKKFPPLLVYSGKFYMKDRVGGGERGGSYTRGVLYDR